MDSLLVRVKSRMFIHAHRKALHLLDGEYASLVTGRSMDFEDLRSYVAGDEVRDIDWKATARSGSTLVRRYSALRRQSVVFVVDSGRSMAAAAVEGEPKSDIALLVVGVLGYLAVRHGDEVAFLGGDAERTLRQASRSSENHLERILRSLRGSLTADAPPSDLDRVLRVLARTVRRRAIVVVVSDDTRPDDGSRSLIRRLRAQHELVWVTVGDVDPLRPARAIAVADGWSIPAALRHDAALADALSRSIDTDILALEQAFEGLGVSHRRIGRSDDVVPSLLHLLKSRHHDRG
ncbi:DUF58 domain-containing protein [Agreia sp. COWG]|uniref:DUF58 domain-containing protein n=1 Tax=Agreia sp. COWG TaxID=2773266 RepID=UPI001926AF2A|nr:DUF58 domain-containing protein [Agreia sp. COWG]CAD6000194.1 DUF58 domain-containing protein [Agreia sp. COWG]